MQVKEWRNASSTGMEYRRYGERERWIEATSQYSSRGGA